jgi:Protein of unknown function (DUF3995)
MGTSPAAARAAAVVGLLSAGVTLYWTLGGTTLLDTVGGSIADAARNRTTSAIAVGVVTFAVKLVGVGLALALVDVDRRRHRRLITRTAKVAALVLVVYGTVNVVGASLGLSGVVGNGTVDRTALWGHALLWDPWFVVWGLLLWWAATTTDKQPSES